MARASVPTMLPLDRFFGVLGMHPLHVNGITVAGLADMTTCSQPIMQHRWQASDAVGREDIAEAIASAEDRLTDYLGFTPAPRWVADERQRAPRMGTPIKAELGYSVSAGIEGKTVIQANAGVSFSDEDGDGYYETATVNVATSLLDAGEIAVYYPGYLGDETWEIRPLKSVTFAAGVLTIKLRREQLVKEELLEAFSADAVDGLVDANFHDSVDVYRHFIDPSQQVQFLWRGENCNCVGVSVCPSCTLTGQFGCATVRDTRQSFYDLGPGLWDAASETYISTPLAVHRPPERIRLWYFAGWRNMRLVRPNVQMDPVWERAIARYAVSMLDRPLCACTEAQNVIDYWSEDLARRTSSAGGGQSFATAKDALGNPLGSSRGAIYAWELAQRYRIGQGVCAL